ncbi:hypothetical protein AB1Y20_021148 [Prymnesium parvum]|uniref:Phosphoglycerate mutase-like protein n=1 Tax=Prymnesium parvum TaxID=97485 RepID=A0AB34JJB1_PRYPA
MFETFVSKPALEVIIFSPSCRMARLFFVRHGEAAHNPLIVRGKAEKNEELLRQGRSIRDPRLTEQGRAQATHLRESLLKDGIKFDLLVTSPMFRAVETSILAFTGVCDTFMLHPYLVETAEPRLGAPQRGHSTAELLEAFPQLRQWDLSQMKEGGSDANWVLGSEIELCGPAYHSPTPIEERLEPLATWLKSLPHERVVVVGHSMVFDKLLGRAMGNCELVEHVI